MPPYFRNLSAAEVLSAFLRLGFRPVGRGRSPHNRLQHTGFGLTAHIPRHRGTLPMGTVTKMVRDSGVSDDEFRMALDGEIPERFRI
ncbi:MAG: addiction module toxin, HicA family [Chloroflexi bacterium]|nr:addiction module toxin, HicA family [Chloroflexota bacterium]